MSRRVRVAIWSVGFGLAASVAGGCASDGPDRDALSGPSTASTQLTRVTTTTSSRAVPGHDHGGSDPGDDDGIRRDLGRTTDGRYLTEIDGGVGIAVSEDPDGTVPSADEQRDAEAFVAETYARLAAFRSIESARSAGYRPVDEHHWVHEDFLADETMGDPDRIESLVYGTIDGEVRLLGAMYLAPEGRHGPQVGGPATVWHYHEYEPTLCVASSGFPLTVADGDRCTQGKPADRSPEMLHVWFVHPEGRFGTEIVLPTAEALDAAQRAAWSQ